MIERMNIVLSGVSRSDPAVSLRVATSNTVPWLGAIPEGFNKELLDPSTVHGDALILE